MVWVVFVLVLPSVLVTFPVFGQDGDPDKRRELRFYGERNGDETTFIDTMTVDRSEDGGERYRKYFGVSSDKEYVRAELGDAQTTFRRIGLNGEIWSQSISTRGGEEHHSISASTGGDLFAVYAYDAGGYESYRPSLRAVVNGEGRVLVEDASYARLAPSGNYLYGESSQSYSADEVLIYGPDLQPAAVQSWVRQTVGADTESTSYNYRILDGDLMVITAFTKTPQNPSRRYVDADLYVLDLSAREVLGQRDYLDDGLPQHRFRFREIEASGSEVLIPADGGMNLFVFDTDTRQFEKTSLPAFDTFQALATQRGPGYALRRDDRVLIYDASSFDLVREMAVEGSNTYLVDQVTTTQGATLRLIESVPDLPELIYEGPGGEQARIYGWFDFDARIGFVPLVDQNGELAVHWMDLSSL